jgi:hypothetical protein
MGEYKLLSIKKSNKSDKKLMAKFINKKTKRTKVTHFGAEGMSDYTIHKDKARRTRYRKRHQKDLRGDPTRAGYLSYYILWGNSTNKNTNIKSFKNRFKL